MNRILRFACLYVFMFTSAEASPAGQLLSHLPLRFEQHRSAAGSVDAAYVAHGGSFDLVLRPAESWIESRGRRVRMTLRGANPRARMEPLDRLPGSANYFLRGRDNWQTNVAGYGRVRCIGVYRGIDLIFHGEGGRLEYDFVVGPHADPDGIQWEFSGHKSLHVDPDGDLVIDTGAGEIRWKRPDVYQEENGARARVDGHFVVRKRTAAFELGPYDRSRNLIIDPTLAYSTYLGGSQNDVARGIALDAAGNIYIAGNTSSTNLPVRSAVQPGFGGTAGLGPMGDAFVAKFSPSGALVYLTYLGGSSNDGALALAVDAAGNAYIAGATTSQDFPTANPYQSRFGGWGGTGTIRTGDAFVAKLNPSGNQLLYSTYLGGSMDDIAMAIAVDSAGNAYVAGATASRDFPTTSSAYQRTMKGLGGEPIRPSTGQPGWDPGDAFVAKLSPSGQLVNGTLFGGALDDAAFTIALDSSGNVYIGGSTISPDLPTTAGALQRTFGGTDIQNFFLNPGDGFVAEFDPTLATLRYATYFGGTGDDTVTGIAIDASGNIYMTGSTSTMDLKTSAGALQSRYAGYTFLPFAIEQLYGDAYVAKINPSSSTPIYLTYLGGGQNDGGAAIAIDSAGNAYVTGFTDSSNFRLAGNPLQSKSGGDGGQGLYIYYGDAFLAVVNPTGTALVYSTYFGGNADDEGYGLALDSSGNVYLTGNTISTNLQTTAGAAQKAFGGGVQGQGGIIYGDAFYAKFSGVAGNGPAISTVTNAFGDSAVIAPNTWVAIKGSNLAPDARIWQQSDFVNSQLPTVLDGVSVTMNGANAFLYYISASQINILTPPDLASGPVQVQVINNGAAATSTVQAQSLSPSFFVFNGGPYVTAVHLNGTDIGPTTLYPGLTTPAKPGETIVVFANGFGSTTVPVVKGSATQGGSLPNFPVVSIGGFQASVSFAGLISPGLYQFNVTVPASLSNGDHPIVATYNGSTTQPGTLITTQQ